MLCLAFFYQVPIASRRQYNLLLSRYQPCELDLRAVVRLPILGAALGGGREAVSSMALFFAFCNHSEKRAPVTSFSFAAKLRWIIASFET